MKEIEAIKVGLTFDGWAGLMETQFRIFRRTKSGQNCPDSWQNCGLVKKNPIA